MPMSLSERIRTYLVWVVLAVLVLGAASLGVHALTRSHPPGWTGPTRRVDRELLGELVWPAEESPLCYVCGPTGFVESVATVLGELGHTQESVKTERFGPTGEDR